MGDRGNILLKNDNIYLYTHWDGANLKQRVKDALIRGQGRWNDPTYLNRIIFCELIQDNILDTTGYGMSNHLTDNENPIVEVDIENQLVVIDKKEWTFEEFIK
jgi:hypothetical protein